MSSMEKKSVSAKKVFIYCHCTPGIETIEPLFSNVADELAPHQSDCVDIMRQFLLYYFCYIGWNESILLYNASDNCFEVDKFDILRSFKLYCRKNELPQMDVSI